MKMEAAGQSASSHDSNLLQCDSGCGRTFGDLCYDTLSRHGFLALLLLLALVLASSICGSHQKSLWFDELFTVIVVSQPTWHRLVQAMPADGNPPLYALLARLSIHLFGMSDLAIRLPSILSFIAALTGVYVFIRRECGVVFGLLAVALTFSESGWTYSFEARPYTLLLAFMVLALVSWQSATRAAESMPPRPRRLALAGMVAGIVGSMMSHNIGIVEVGVPLLFGEAVRLYRTRRPDWPVLATALAAIPTIAVTLPMMRRTRDLLLSYTHVAMRPLTLAKLHQYWIDNPKPSLPLILNFNLIEIMAIIVLVSWTPRWLNRSQADGPARSNQDLSIGPPAHIIAAALGASLLIPATTLAMMFSTGYYNCRYGIGCIAGIAMLACLLIGAGCRRQSTICLSLFAFLLLTYVHGYISTIRHPPGPTDRIASILSSDQSGLPIVISDPFSYLPTWWYTPASMKNRFVYLSDKPAGIQPGYLVAALALNAEKPLIAARLEDFSGFLDAHDHFLLSTDVDIRSVFLKDRLEGAGYRATLLRSDGYDNIYDMQRRILPGTLKPVKASR
jgi:hypothetical protein